MIDSVTDLRIEQFRILNYRVLRDVVLKDITPLTVFCGPNGSGKSTVIDVFAFLHAAFTTSLRRAWDERNRLAEIRSRGQSGPVGIEIKYRTNLDGKSRLATYSLELGESRGVPVVQTERLRWTTAPGSGKPRFILDFSSGEGFVFDEDAGETRSEKLTHSDSLAVAALGQLSRHPRVTALRDFISGWYLSYVNVSNLRNTPISGPSPRLSQTGDNLANVLQYLGEQHPDRLAQIFSVLSQRIPRLEKSEQQSPIRQRFGRWLGIVMTLVQNMMRKGASLGDLWREGYLGADPLYPERGLA